MDEPAPGFRDIHVCYELDDRMLTQSTRLSLKVFDRLPWLATGLGGLFVLMGGWSLVLSLLQGNLPLTWQLTPYMLPLTAVGFALIFRERLICWLTLRNLRKSQMYGKQVQLHLDENGYTISQRGGSTRIKYSALEKTVTGRDAILLYMNPSAFNFAPREGFARPEDFERLAELLAEKTKNRRL